VKVSDVLSTVGRRAWLELGGDAADLELVRAPEPPLFLPSRLDAAGLLGDCVSLATLAIHRIQVARGTREVPAPVHVHGGRVVTAAQSERHFRLDGEAPVVWSPLSGFWPAYDGWVRTHANYPHHAERLARVLGLEGEPTVESAAAAIARWPALELEDAAAEAGAVVGAVRTPEQWAAHPHAIALRDQPLVHVRADGAAAPAPWAGTGPLPLAGIRVLDLTRVLAGPVATRNLALAGADVLRVDSPRLPEIGWVHLDTGAGKSSCTLDLRSTGDRRALLDLLDRADVVVTGYRPGSLDRLGLSPDALVERRPGLVVGTVSAWGTDGPWSGRRGFDSVVQAVTGIAMVESGDGRQPGALPAQALDHSAGHLLTAALCSALVSQRTSGGSRVVQVALAGLARELLRTGDQPADQPADQQRRTVRPCVAGRPTTQVGNSPAGTITCAAPPLSFDGAPAAYPRLATPWGADEPRWTGLREPVGEGRA
jgi:crotonobetainyl-CoA:carnitine CoA-transferase CaiB-like acyl-CoA transferase